MKSTLEGVRAFHDTYGLPVKDAPDLSDKRTNDLRISLLQEELDELKEALAEGNEKEVLDAGFTQHVDKPIEMSFLASAVADVINARRMSQEAKENARNLS